MLYNAKLKFDKRQRVSRLTENLNLLKYLLHKNKYIKSEQTILFLTSKMLKKCSKV